MIKTKHIVPNIFNYINAVLWMHTMTSLMLNTHQPPNVRFHYRTLIKTSPNIIRAKQFQTH